MNLICKQLYYTNTHEWINFKETFAYVGVCTCKLKGLKQIENIWFTALGLKKQGEILAILRHKGCQIQIIMPVDGVVMELNAKLVNGNLNILLDCAESSGWLAMIKPIEPYGREGLLRLKQYLLNSKKKLQNRN